MNTYRYNHGGPAFPEPFVPQSSGVSLNMHPGMSLRQHFAGLAMAALLSRLDTFCNSVESYEEVEVRKSEESMHRELARLAYQQADAMIAAGEAK